MTTARCSAELYRIRWSVFFSVFLPFRRYILPASSMFVAAPSEELVFAGCAMLCVRIDWMRPYNAGSFLTQGFRPNSREFQSE